MSSKQRNDIEAAREIFAGCAFFNGLPAEEREGLFRKAHLRSLAPRQTVFLMGTPGDSLMAVLTGKIRISVPSADGKEIVVAMLGPGEIFGELSVFDGEPRSAAATAGPEPTCIAVLERRDVLYFLDRNPQAWRAIVEVLCRRLRNSDDQVASVAMMQVPARLAKTLLSLADESRGAKKTGLELTLSQRELGSRIGATRETVNKCLREWQRQGIVRIGETGVIISNPDALEDLAAPC